MARVTINQLIVNSPYEEPVKHWRYDRATRLFDLAESRRPAGYVVASKDSKAFDDLAACGLSGLADHVGRRPCRVVLRRLMRVFRQVPGDLPA